MDDRLENEVVEQTSIEDECHKDNQCPATVHETVCVKAKVTITPDVKVHDIKYSCGNDPIIWDCEESKECSDSCTFEVGQKICVEIPLTFSANAQVDPLGIVCGTPEKGKCHKKPPCKPKTAIWDSEIKRDIILDLIGGFIVSKIEKFIKSKGFLK
ncbi:hypothetical protein LPY66_07525 [Dehalobacter sp. DCM]|uniref:hypothetical protein n=1 Tax=Dehalobacter sp. DCM TaxID=2907827 RepID=UPI0030819107|nr:hypothetical protein LPY66_07525 [Dehalobacter sp. DCM]